MGKVIHWELCKKLNNEHTDKRYEQNTEIVSKKETNKVLRDIEIKNLIPAWQKKKKKKKRTSRIVDFAVPADFKVKVKENEKRDKYLDLSRELKTIEHEGDDICSNWCARNNHQIAQTSSAAEYTDCTSAEGLDLTNECLPYDAKQPDGESPLMQKLWGMLSTPSLTSLPGRLCLGMVASDRVK